MFLRISIFALFLAVFQLQAAEVTCNIFGSKVPCLYIPIEDYLKDKNFNVEDYIEKYTQYTRASYVMLPMVYKGSQRGIPVLIFEEAKLSLRAIQA